MSAANQPYSEAQKAMMEKFNAHIREDSSSFAAPTGLAGVKPKCKHCGDTGMLRNDQSDQGWDDCIWCSK